MKSLDVKKLPPNRRAVAIAFVVTGILSVLFWWKGGGQVKGISTLKISYNVENRRSPSEKDTSRTTSMFVSELQAELEKAKGIYSIYVYRLEEKTSYGISENETMPAASIMKVPIMATAFQASESGTLKIDKNLDEQLMAMGRRSDNVAPATFINKLGRPALRAALVELEMTSSNFDENTITARDVGQMFKNLYEGKFIARPNRETLWEYLTDSIFEERIPAGVPEDVRVIHKVGTDLDIWADAGIIMAPEPYVLVILNDDVNQEQAREVVPKLVKMIWEFETARK